MSLEQLTLPDPFAADLLVNMAKRQGVSAMKLEEDDPRHVVIDTEHERFGLLMEDFGLRLPIIGVMLATCVEGLAARYAREVDSRARNAAAASSN